MSDIGLSDFIEALRNELERSIAASEKRRLRFATSKIDLELETVVETTKDGNGNVSIKFWVINGQVGGNVNRQSQTTQKISVSLMPSYDGKPPGQFLVAADAPVNKTL
jgi:hypothetical protein